ncbi:hypothetical protein Vadar_014901 [Vaccinium darrowii]|uniref:Uncharacterized protein n=1 Tax=Vaccinium darrowii TaxID=229202 RepID=A0ACB7Y6S0_9ERIC|nr:hypothetical protein Vadar_014901 [Vaccinium darrowii]
MDLGAILIAAGINLVICIGLFSVYSGLRERPSCENVYFRGRPPHFRSYRRSFVRFIPRWMQEAWQASEEEILAAGGLDAVVFLRLITFSIQIFSIAAIFCLPLIPFNYSGKEMLRQHIPSLPLDVFTIGNVREGSKWLWLHCLALYIISSSACVLLFLENKNITKMRLEHIAGSSLNPRYFTILVRAIPSSREESHSDSLRNFFTKYHAPGYLSHQMVYRPGTVKKFMNDASKMIKCTSTEQFGTDSKNCYLCVGNAYSFEVLSSEPESARSRNDVADPNLRDQECAAALVFFKTRSAALVASQVLQSEDLRSWVTDLAPEPHDVYWKNLSIPYQQLWRRRTAILFASSLFVILFMVLVAFVQGFVHPEELEKVFPFLRDVLKKKFMDSLITGYLPSVVLMLFLYAVPPTMVLFSTIEGPISRIGRKKNACSKFLYFLIWNVFFVSVSSADIMQRLSMDSSPKDIAAELATTVPRQATFFMNYVLTSGWMSLAFEILQPCALVCNFFCKYILRKKEEPSNGTLSFPYHTEIPKVLLFGFLGFTYSPMAPLILPILLVYFLLASLIYRNQILNVYAMKYQSGGQFWPVMHNTIIFSLVLTQVLVIGVFGLKRTPVAAASVVPLICFTLVFNKYCRQKFHRVFQDSPAQGPLSDMDKRDEECGNLELIHNQLPSVYCQFGSTSNHLQLSAPLNPDALCRHAEQIRHPLIRRIRLLYWTPMKSKEDIFRTLVMGIQIWCLLCAGFFAGSDQFFLTARLAVATDGRWWRVAAKIFGRQRWECSDD